MKKLTTLITLSLLLTITLSGQSVNRRSEFKTGAGIQLIGPTFVASGELDYFFTHNFNAEIGAGLYGTYVSAKYYFGSSEKETPWAPYFGVSYKLPGILTGDKEGGFYFPLGIQYISKNGFTFAPEYGIINTGAIKTALWGALRVGYHF